MGTKLYVGNLPYSCSDADLANHFGAQGNVSSARVIIDRETGRSKGFGFVEMETDDEARRAVEQLNGKPFMGRPLTVNEAKPREEGSGGGGFNPRRNNGGPRRDRDREGGRPSRHAN